MAVRGQVFLFQMLETFQESGRSWLLALGVSHEGLGVMHVSSNQILKTWRPDQGYYSNRGLSSFFLQVSLGILNPIFWSPCTSFCLRSEDGVACSRSHPP